jgi:hypothetical protein
MKLLHIDDSDYNHISERMDAIKTIYQMEQEFYPYLQIEFCKNPQKCGGVGIILQTKNGNIKKDFAFTDGSDIIELRKLIWSKLIKEENIVNRSDTDVEWHESSTKMRLINPMDKLIESSSISSCPNIPNDDIDMDTRNKLMHSSYKMQKYKPSVQTNKNTCILNRIRECDQKSPVGSEANSMCKLEGKILCNNSSSPVTKCNNTVSNFHKNRRTFNPIGKLYPIDKIYNIEHFGKSDNDMWSNNLILITITIILISQLFIK